MQLNNNDEQTAAVRRELENRSARVSLGGVLLNIIRADTSWRGSASSLELEHLVAALIISTFVLKIRQLTLYSNSFF